MALLQFLSEVKANLANIDKYETVHVVIGNESCDLDSVISAITYAFYLKQVLQSSSTLVVPILNIPHGDFTIRTDSVYVLGKHGINSDHAICRDNLDLRPLHESRRLKVTLVDCNVFPEEPELDRVVVEVIDHHKLVRESSDGISLTVEIVGSCTTLVAEKLTKDERFTFDPVVAELLHATILTDTINLNPEAKKVTPKDIEYVEKLECCLPAVDRTKVYNEIQVAKANISGLTTLELLRRDLKFVTEPDVTIAMSSIPVHLQQFLTRVHVVDDLMTFLKSRKADAVVVMTTSPTPSGGSIERQLGIYSPVEELRKKISQSLQTTSSPPLDLQPMKTTVPAFVAFLQGNVAASRKQILPLIRVMFK
ncbi:exopolyphosphatase PRUNE1-like [Lineus longissimus]|uniref:exopolyphosphatase PRUNE1-like n=1 Tax=Lineus longissimus TaxID=88925 RepID=UPI002B4C4267